MTIKKTRKAQVNKLDCFANKNKSSKSNRSVIAVFTCTNDLWGGNVPGFETTAPNKPDVKTPLENSIYL